MIGALNLTSSRILPSGDLFMFDCLGYYALIGDFLARNRPTPILHLFADMAPGNAVRRIIVGWIRR